MHAPPAPTDWSVPESLNIADWFLDRRMAEGHGQRTALHLDQRTVTYAEVHTLVHRMAHHLDGVGIRPDDRVMLALTDGLPFVVTFFAVLELGAVVVMVNPDQEGQAIEAVSDYVQPAAIVVERAFADRFANHGHMRRGGVLLPLDEAEDGSPSHLDGAPLGATAGRFPTAPTHRDDAAVFLFSGGTTGRPKAVVQSHGAFVNTTELYAKRTLGYRADDVTLSVPKLYFGYATGSNLLFPFAVGGSTVLFREPPTPEALFARIRRHRPTILINVPTLISRMLAHPDAATLDLSSLRFATSAGEALPIPLYERWCARFGVPLLDGLGTAEMWHVFLTNTLEATRPGPLGRAVPGFEVQVRDGQDRPVADGEVGRLWVRGDSRALGYWRNLTKSCDAFRGPWFVGGDLVSRDADGYVRYCGRGDDVMKVGGKWLVPAEVESCLARHPEVAECAVIGAQDDAGLTKPYAFVRPTADADGDLEQRLKDHALATMQAYKHPRRVIVLDAFPRTHLGKIDRGALRRLL